MLQLYEKIEALCELRSVNITTMCKSAGIPRSALSDYKAGRKQTISIVNMQRLAEYFDVSVDYLLGKEKSPSSDELTRELGETEFALYGEVKELTDDQKQDILDYIRYKKAKGGWKE